MCEEQAFSLATTESQMRQIVQTFGIDCEHFPKGRWAGCPERSVQMMTRAVNCYYTPSDATLRGLVDGSFRCPFILSKCSLRGEIGVLSTLIDSPLLKLVYINPQSVCDCLCNSISICNLSVYQSYLHAGLRCPIHSRVDTRICPCVTKSTPDVAVVKG